MNLTRFASTTRSVSASTKVFQRQFARRRGVAKAAPPAPAKSLEESWVAVRDEQSGQIVALTLVFIYLVLVE